MNSDPLGHTGVLLLAQESFVVVHYELSGVIRLKLYHLGQRILQIRLLAGSFVHLFHLNQRFSLLQINVQSLGKTALVLSLFSLVLDLIHLVVLWPRTQSNGFVFLDLNSQR
jgi:hypothetical protein